MVAGHAEKTQAEIVSSTEGRMGAGGVFGPLNGIKGSHRRTPLWHKPSPHGNGQVAARGVGRAHLYVVRLTASRG